MCAVLELAAAACGHTGMPVWSTWSTNTHRLFPAAMRERAVELLKLAYLLASSSKLGAESWALIDVWRSHVIPMVLFATTEGETMTNRSRMNP